MPPKQKIRKDKIKGNVSCTGRDITSLSDYANNDTLPRGFLAYLLEKDDKLKYFNVLPNVNECMYTFPNSEWFGVNVSDSNIFGNTGVYYFKIKTTTDGPRIDQGTSTFNTPIELVDINPCVVNEEGKCASPPKEKRGKSKKVTGSQMTDTEMIDVTENLPNDLKEQIEIVQVGIPKSSKPKQSKSRIDFEKMDIEQIKEWMKNNMYTTDILTCIRQSALNDQQKEQLNNIEKYVPPPENEVNEVNEDVQAMDIAEQLPPQEVKKMFKRISKEDIVKELNQVDPSNRQQAIVELCHKSGKNYRIEIRRNKLKIIDNKGEIVDDDDALDECASFEAERIRQRMLSRWTSTMRTVKDAKEKGKYSPQELDLDLAGLSLNSFGKKKNTTRLRKTVGYVSSKKRKRSSPESSATLHKVGTIRKGLDGNMWTIKKASNSVKRWVKERVKKYK
jgi:hypothetical protein